MHYRKDATAGACCRAHQGKWERDEGVEILPQSPVGETDLYAPLIRKLYMLA